MKLGFQKQYAKDISEHKVITSNNKTETDTWTFEEEMSEESTHDYVSPTYLATSTWDWLKLQEEISEYFWLLLKHIFTKKNDWKIGLISSRKRKNNSRGNLLLKKSKEKANTLKVLCETFVTS